MKTIVITGCSTGFGFQAAQVFANRGDKVFATMRDLQGKNSEAAAQLREASPNISVVELDVLSDASVESASAAILDGGVAPDVLINNAGQMYVGIAEAFTADEFSRQLDINVVGIHRVNRGLLPAMRAAGKGLIINVSSVAGRFGAPFFSIYHASKWAVEGYSLGMRARAGFFGSGCSGRRARTLFHRTFRGKAPHLRTLTVVPLPIQKSCPKPLRLWAKHLRECLWIQTFPLIL